MIYTVWTSFISNHIFSAAIFLTQLSNIPKTQKMSNLVKYWYFNQGNIQRISIPHKTKHVASASNRAEKCAWFWDRFQGIAGGFRRDQDPNPAMNVDDFLLMTFKGAVWHSITIYSPTYVIKHLNSLHYRSHKFAALIQQAPAGLWAVIHQTTSLLPLSIHIYPTRWQSGFLALMKYKHLLLFKIAKTPIVLHLFLQG